MEDSASGSSLLDNAPRPEYLAKVVATRAELRADLQAALGESTRFVWEVGCGHGHFLTAYAARHRDDKWQKWDGPQIAHARAKARRGNLGPVPKYL